MSIPEKLLAMASKADLHRVAQIWNCDIEDAGELLADLWEQCYRTIKSPTPRTADLLFAALTLRPLDSSAAWNLAGYFENIGNSEAMVSLSLMANLTNLLSPEAKLRGSDELTADEVEGADASMFHAARGFLDQSCPMAVAAVYAVMRGESWRAEVVSLLEP